MNCSSKAILPQKHARLLSISSPRLRPHTSASARGHRDRLITASHAVCATLECMRLPRFRVRTLQASSLIKFYLECENTYTSSQLSYYLQTAKLGFAVANASVIAWSSLCPWTEDAAAVKAVLDDAHPRCVLACIRAHVSVCLVIPLGDPALRAYDARMACCLYPSPSSVA